MSATPTFSPRLRDAAPQLRSSRPTAARTNTPASVGQALPPMRPHDSRTPAHIPPTPQTPSPNYFGLTVDPAADCFSSSAAQHVRGNWSPPTSKVRSTVAASPRVIPVDQNPEFEQFRRQSEHSAQFNLGRLSDFGLGQPPTSIPSNRPAFIAADPAPSPKSALPTSPKASSNTESGKAVEYLAKPRSPKRLLSSDSSLFPDRPRRNSPASFTEESLRSAKEVAFLDSGHQRPSLPASKSHLAFSLSNHRAETLPAHPESDGKVEGPVFVTPQHVVNLLDSAEDEILLLDLRVSTQYARSRIVGALSLCVPTTLLKRVSFNVQKLAETFKDYDHREKFERWRSSKYIIVYDSDSSQLKDAAACVNILKKFTNEDWKGSSYIIRGGFSDFFNKFPSLVASSSSSGSTSSSSPLSIDSSGPAVAPVVGGCPLPATQNAANPFFGNIRQNMDLIGGVGQMPIKHPAALTAQVEAELPSWLRKAVDTHDNGKLVSDKFLHIEKREQKRMQEALSSKVVYGTPTPEVVNVVRIAGIEKGSKNRYNSIWPYEHSRVKLQGVSDGACDYVNANHVQASWTNKRYIATQGPLPTTFNDFWNVIWQQDVRVIVMLTAEQEGGQVKAHNYWGNNQYGPLQLKFLGEHRASLELSKIHRKDRPSLGQRRSTNPPQLGRAPKESPSPSFDSPYVIVRKFTLSHADHPFARMREITQLQYSSWPDFGAPAHPAHLLGLIEQCDAVVRQVNGGQPSGPDPPNSRPILVHCSAGCGRTGTFCTVDSVLDMLKRQRQERNTRQGTPMDVDSNQKSNTFPGASAVGSKTEIMDESDLVEKTVEDFRLQRLSMVQSLRQFVLCYESVLEWLVEQQPKSA
ncbi:tyrosine-protein phosphatase-like protein non-receptor [Mytilinidion resinicola]|uniref:protein-tyrosine-phosphatase n=1 Tax=Mytilinidion resinicola TaxID=574789 RepID=A0A6A6Y540_9PEZI|nr:tyrosine-protein phosphatase-like protein non-receptor [Mytilinidion resinicola]KAF2803739.1 tyrosine-protein phosphatase-like protein non-receptor [Mytilinidion resinicola]